MQISITGCTWTAELPNILLLTQYIPLIDILFCLHIGLNIWSLWCMSERQLVNFNEQILLDSEQIEFSEKNQREKKCRRKLQQKAGNNLEG